MNDFPDSKYCELPEEYYRLEKELMNVYEKVRDVRYVLIENFEYKDNIKIYHNNIEIKFDVIISETNKLIIDLKKTYMSENLLFFIDNAENYKISFYTDKSLVNYIISKEITNEKILVPNKKWITSKTRYVNYHTKEKLKNSDLTKLSAQYYRCYYEEIYVYKYEIKKEYYDNDYHLNVDGYIKDTNDYKIFYKGKPITNIIEIEKEKIINKPKYIYVEKEPIIKEDDSSKNETTCLPIIKTEIKKEIIEKEIFKIPKTIYAIITLLLIAIIILIIKIIKKYVV